MTLGLVLVPVLLGQAVVGHPQAVRVAAGALAVAAAGAAVVAAAGRRSGLRVRHRDHQHPVLVRFPGSFYTLHFYGAWVFTAAFVVHFCLKFPKMRAGLKARRMRDVLRTDLGRTARTVREAGPASAAPSAPTCHAAVRSRSSAGRRWGSSGGDGRPEPWRSFPAARRARAATPESGRTAFKSTRPLQASDQRDRDRETWRLHCSGPAARRPITGPTPGRTVAHAAAHREPPDRLRRGLVDRQPEVDRRAPAGSRPLSVSNPSAGDVESFSAAAFAPSCGGRS